jgi:transcriptional regulator with XRE-family HTH domain
VPEESRKVSKKAQREQWHRAAVAVIAATRRDAEIKQDDLAAKLGWSRSKVAKIEAGDRRIELPDFILIARALNTDPETLFRRVMRW